MSHLIHQQQDWQTRPMAGGPPPGYVGGQAIFPEAPAPQITGGAGGLGREDAAALVSECVRQMTQQLGLQMPQQAGSSLPHRNNPGPAKWMPPRDARIGSLSQGIREPPPKAAAPEKTFSSDGPISRTEMAEIIAMAVGAAMREQGRRDEPSIFATGDEDGRTEVSGARGAAQYARLKASFERNPDESFHDTRRRARIQLASPPGAPTRFTALTTEMPFGSFATLKRVFYLFTHMMEAFEVDDLPRARGLTAQGMRWVALALDTSNDPLTGWRMTFLPDPIPLAMPARTSITLDLNSTILCPEQLTAILGLGRDLELLTKRMAGIKTLPPQRDSPALEDAPEKKRKPPKPKPKPKADAAPPKAK